MIGVIADDLTGAAEVGAVGWRCGRRAEIVVGGQPSGEADLVCVDTDSRSCRLEEAAWRVAGAAQLLVEAGADWIYKKVDSVLRGEVTAELEASMQAMRLSRALLVPANPSLGRVIREGRYFVGGRPIDETEFARDPEHPRRSAKVLDLLGRPQALPICICGAGEALPADGIIVGEVGTAEAVREWAARWTADMLPAGGAEFFAALLAVAGRRGEGEGDGPRAPAGGSGHKARRGNADGKWPGRAPARRREFGGSTPEPPSAPAAGRELLVCGTTSRSASDFVRGAEAAGVPVFSLPAELAQGADLSSAAAEALARRAVDALGAHRRVILRIGLPPVSERVVARLLAVHLVAVAERVLRQVDVERVYAEGGATAAELVRRMGWTRLTVAGELAPGVVTLAVSGSTPFQLTIKPGTYAWPVRWGGEWGA